MGPPLFDPEKQVWEAYEHAAVPRNRSEATKFARVCEMLDDGMAIWRGEWLYDFPKYRNLSTDDLADWKNWVNNSGVEQFLDEIIELCTQYARNSEDAAGYFLTGWPGNSEKIAVFFRINRALSFATLDLYFMTLNKTKRPYAANPPTWRIFAVIRRASSLLSSLAAERRPGSLS
jgi:hypothetical protein